MGWDGIISKMIGFGACLLECFVKFVKFVMVRLGLGLGLMFRRGDGMRFSVVLVGAIFDFWGLDV